MARRSRRDLPHPLSRTVDVGGETYTVDRSQPPLDVSQVLAWGFVGSVVVIVATAIVALAWGPVALGVGGVGVLALGAWFVLGLVVLPVLSRRRRGDELVLDAVGLVWNGQRVPWHELVAIDTQPYPFANGAYVYCIELRLRSGEVLRIAADVPAHALDVLEDVIEDCWDAAPRELPAPDPDLGALDALVGRHREIP